MRNPFLTALLFLMTAGPLGAQESLGYNLREGDVFLVEQRAEQQIFQEMEDTVHQLTNRVSAVLQFRVLERKDSTFLLEFSFRDFFFSIKSNLQGELLDVRAQELDEADLQSRIFHSMLNQPVTMELGKRGNILRVIGADSLVSKMMASTGLEAGDARDALRQSLEREYGSRALASSYEQMTFFYPAKPVRAGDRWMNKYKGDLQASNTWLLDSLHQGHAVISGESVIRMQAADSAAGMDLKGTQQIRVVTETGSGFIREMIVRGEAEGCSRTPESGDLEIPTRIRTQITYSLIDHRHVQ